MTEIKYYRRALIFDVETTGLLSKKSMPLDECPYVIQLSYIMYNMYDHNIESVYDAYINIPQNVEISAKITELTGITREISNTGIPMSKALVDFYDAYSKCDCIIGHNIDFDSKMILVELERNRGELLEKNPSLGEMFQNRIDIKTPERFCTMMSSIDRCGIMISAVDKLNKPYKYKKFPKLSETYECLFRSVPTNLHNSMMDSLVCLRCYLKIRHGVDVHESKFRFWVEKYLDKPQKKSTDIL